MTSQQKKVSQHQYARNFIPYYQADARSMESAIGMACQLWACSADVMSESLQEARYWIEQAEENESNPCAAPTLVLAFCEEDCKSRKSRKSAQSNGAKSSEATEPSAGSAVGRKMADLIWP